MQGGKTQTELCSFELSPHAPPLTKSISIWHNPFQCAYLNTACFFPRQDGKPHVRQPLRYQIRSQQSICCVFIYVFISGRPTRCVCVERSVPSLKLTGQGMESIVLPTALDFICVILLQSNPINWISCILVSPRIPHLRG